VKGKSQVKQSEKEGKEAEDVEKKDTEERKSDKQFWLSFKGLKKTGIRPVLDAKTQGNYDFLRSYTFFGVIYK
jgi:hypothetical protein